MITDIHGHSRMMNMTLYGCSPDSDHKHSRKYAKMKSAFASLKLASMDYFLPNYVTDTADRYKLFAYLLAQRASNSFSYDQCIWNISKQKEGTARVVFWRQFNIQNAFTFESTFCGSNLSPNVKGFHFNTAHYLQCGAKFCAALYDICSDASDSKARIQSAIKHLKAMQVANGDTSGNAKKGKYKKSRSKRNSLGE